MLKIQFGLIWRGTIPGVISRHWQRSGTGAAEQVRPGLRCCGAMVAVVLVPQIPFGNMGLGRSGTRAGAGDTVLLSFCKPLCVSNGERYAGAARQRGKTLCLAGQLVKEQTLSVGSSCQEQTVYLAFP